MINLPDFHKCLHIKTLPLYYHPTISLFRLKNKSLYIDYIHRRLVISGGSKSQICPFSSYLPGSEDTVISKAVPSGRDFPIALRGG